MISLILESSEDILILFSGGITERLLFSVDIFWMIKKLKYTDSQEESQIWVHLIQWVFDRQDREQIDAIIAATQINKILREKFLSFFEAVELNSANAKKMEAEYIEMQEWNGEQHAPPLLYPSPQERILKLLCQLESGDLSAWWKLNLAMTLRPDSQSYDNEYEWDLTKLPGWRDADEGTQQRVINGAKKYIQQENELFYDRIGNNPIMLDRPAMGGCRALLILLKLDLDFLNSLSSEVCSRWIPAVIASPCNSYHEDEYLEIVRLSYLKAPDQAINTLMTLIENENHDYISAIDRFQKCWDNRLKNALLEKIKDSSLNPQLMSQLLEELLRHQCIEAKEFAQSLFSKDLIEEDHERTLIAAEALIKNSDSSTWLFIWPFISINNPFGRVVFEKIARFHSSILFDLTETQLADLYLWLVREYPHSEDPDHSNEIGAYTITVRDNLAKLRDGVLRQLTKKGTLQACDEIQRLIQTLPHLTWLSSILPDAQKNMRRDTWNPPRPEEILRLTLIQAPSTSDLLTPINEINQGMKKMAYEPRVDKSVHISNSKNIREINTGDGNTRISLPNDKTGFDWKFWLSISVTATVALISVAASGVFNDEIKNFFKQHVSPQVEQKPEK